MAGESHRFDADVALRGADRLVVEISGAVGGPRAILALEGANVVVLLPAERSYIAGPADKALFQALVGLPVDGPSLIRLMAFVGSAGNQEEVVSGLRVARQDDGSITAAPLDPDPSGFLGLTMRVRDREDVPAGSLPESLFSPAIPDGWRRLSPERDAAGGPLLLP